jgi:hypothetical protein
MVGDGLTEMDQNQTEGNCNMTELHLGRGRKLWTEAREMLET